jgi:phage terminase small subunit
MLTPKREAFAQAVASGMSQADAYRAAFSVKPTTKPETVQQSASRLMADPIVSARVAEIRKPIVKRAQITLESHLADLQMLRDRALEAEQYSAAISAEVSRGKASGLYTDKVEHSGSIKFEDMTDEDLDRRIAALKAAED